MNLIEIPTNESFQPDYIVITGDGRMELRVIRGFCNKLNGSRISIFFPFSTRSGKTGLSALDAVKLYSKRSRLNSMIYIVDGDTFSGKSAKVEINNYLTSRGLKIISITQIIEALLIQIKYGDKEIIIYCIISGPEFFIEQEIAQLLKICYGYEFNISINCKDQTKKQFKKEIYNFIKKNKIKIENLIGETGEAKLEKAFPNYFAVFKKIEKEHN